jgi:hypothetical protein
MKVQKIYTDNKIEIFYEETAEDSTVEGCIILTSDIQMKRLGEALITLANTGGRMVEIKSNKL